MLKKVLKFHGRQRVRIGAAALLFVACALAKTGRAQQPTPADIANMSVEELMNVEVDTVYGASKFQQKVTDAPSYVTIINADEIAKHGFRTLADVLQTVPGFYVNYDRNYSYVGVRGVERSGDYTNDRILLLIDGHRVNENVYESLYAGTDCPVDLDLVERVEIIRGPGSALYGADAFLAVINVIMKRGRDVKGEEVSGSAGSLQTFETRATYGDQPKHGPETLLSGTFYHSLGNQRLFYPEFDSPATNDGYAADADGDGARGFFGRMQYKDFSVEGLYHWRDKTVPTASYGTVFNDPRTKTIDEDRYIDVQYQHKFENQWTVLGRFAFDAYDYHGTYVMDYAGTGIPPFTLNQDFADGKWLTVEADASKTFYEKHRVTVGTETRWNIQQNQENYDQAPYVLYLNARHSSTAPSFFLQDEFSIRTNLILNAGVRYDEYSGIGSSTNPRLGLICSPLERTTVKLLYGRAFRVPNQFELYYADGNSEEGNPALQPETIQTTELNLEQYLTKHTQILVSGYFNSINGLITEQIDPTTGLLRFTNLQNVQGKGLTFEWAGKWADGWEGRLAYTVQETRDETTGSILTNSPRHLPKIDFTAPIVPRRLFFCFDGQYVSQRETLEGTMLGGFFVANATVSAANLYKGLTISGSAYNLFDRRYADPGGPEHRQIAIPQDGRTLALKLTYRFKRQE